MEFLQFWGAKWWKIIRNAVQGFQSFWILSMIGELRPSMNLQNAIVVCMDPSKVLHEYMIVQWSNRTFLMILKPALILCYATLQLGCCRAWNCHAGNSFACKSRRWKGGQSYQPKPVKTLGSKGELHGLGCHLSRDMRQCHYFDIEDKFCFWFSYV